MHMLTFCLLLCSLVLNHEIIKHDLWKKWQKIAQTRPNVFKQQACVQQKALFINTVQW